jgi:Tol biopolymer transport system component
VTQLRDQGGRVDWSSNLRLIAFDRAGPSGFFDVYVMGEDGGGVRCLTCETRGVLPEKHKGNPAWHPSGQYIVFQAQRVVPQQRDDTVSAPGAGVFNDLWLMTPDAKSIWQLYAPPFEVSRSNLRDAPGTLHPQFSPDGKRLAWAERLRGGGAIGEWALKVGDFSISPEGPKVTNVRTYQPGSNHAFYESHSFSIDGAKLLFSGNLERGQGVQGMDIYELTLATSEVKRLTESPRIWDEHAHYSPDGSTIVWMSNEGQPPVRQRPYRFKAELWVMNADGSGKRQLTHLNTPGTPEYIPGNIVAPADSSWGSDGTRLVAVVLESDPSSGDRDRGRIVMVDC